MQKNLHTCNLWSKANTSAKPACFIVPTTSQLACESLTGPCSTSEWDVIPRHACLWKSCQSPSPCSSSATAFRAAMQAVPSLAPHQHPASSMHDMLLSPAHPHPFQHRGAAQTQPGLRAVMLSQRSFTHLTRPHRGDRSPAAAAASRGGGSQPSTQQGLCPLHACLLQHGIAELAPFSTPKHLGLSQEAVSSTVEPKLAALAAEGLSPAQMARLLAGTRSPLWCSFDATFLPNLELLRKILVLSDYQPHPQALLLTAVGRLLAGAPARAARFLSRDHAKVERLVGWLEGSLGIGLAELAGCNILYQVLSLRVETAQAVCSMLLGQGVPVAEVERIFLRRPTLFSYSPKLLQARLAFLQRELELDAAAALGMAVGQPGLLTRKMEDSLPPLLHFLDGYMGEEGAGRRLVLRQPAIGALTGAGTERSVSGLVARGYSQEQICGFVTKYPTLLAMDLGSPTQQQKLDWIATASPWTLDNFLANPRYFGADTRRLGSRLDFLRQHGLVEPSSPSILATTTPARFMSMMCKRLAKQGRALAVADWASWEGAWLQTDAGKKWGYPPLAY
jgi:hypothetical protein